MVKPRFECSVCDRLFLARNLIKATREGASNLYCKKCLRDTEPIETVIENEYSINSASKFLGCSFQYMRKLVMTNQVAHRWNITHHHVRIQEKDLLELKKKLEYRVNDKTVNVDDNRTHYI